MTIWMTVEQCAEVLEAHADLRRDYLSSAELRRPGAYNDPATSRSDQALILETAAYESAAGLLRHLREMPINLPTWREHEWPGIVHRITGLHVERVGE